ncbi:MAG: hypothetical protein Q4F41_14700 [Eubacteriales bacterium]|nr:hypothetical protein [Eubacteriales bacterium]
MKKAKILFVTACTLGILTGCSKFDPDGTAIMARKDGDVTAVVMETLDQSYYDSTELQNLINQDVAAYNASAGAENITVKEFEVVNQTANLTMDYASGEDYAAFNNVTFYTGDVLGAYDAGYDFQTTFQKVEKGNVTDSQVTRQEVLNSYNYYTVIMEEAMDVQVEGSIVYASSNVQITGKNTCRVVSSSYASQTEAEETEASTMEDGTVLLSPTSVTASTQDGAKDLAYILYE